jgi:hypothetical protein
MKQFYLLSAILFLISSCVSSPWLVNESKVYVDEKVADLIYSDRTLTFFPFSDKVVTVYNPESVTKVYNIDSSFASTLIRDSLYNYFCHKSNSTVTNVKLSDVELPTEISEDDTSTANYFPLTKNLDIDKSYTFMIPNEEYLNSLNVEPDIILVINKIETGDSSMFMSHGNNIANFSSGAISGGIGTGSSTPYLSINLEFILWDYKNNKPIKYGNILVKTDQSHYNEDEIWNASYKNVIKEIVYRTPFELKSGIRVMQN